MDGVYKHYVIDLSCNNNFVQVPTVQGDGNNVRGFEVELISNNVQYVVDAENTIVSIAGTKPDTKQILNECEVTEEGFILVDITNQMSAVAGRGDYSITLMDKNTNALLQSFPFYILTTKSAFDGAEIVSSNEFTLLVSKITDVERLEKEVRQNEEIRNNNEDTRISNENVREQNEEVRKQNETSRETNEANRILAEDQRVKQELDREDNELVRLDNEDARIENEDQRISTESLRDANETTRTDNENIRQDNETNRIDEEATRQANELQRISDEDLRMQNETIRQQQETNRQTASSTAIDRIEKARTNAVEATKRANDISEDLERKVATDYYRGEPGRDGIITTVDINQMAFNVVDGNLILTYEEGNTDAQKFSIDGNGDLIYTLS